MRRTSRRLPLATPRASSPESSCWPSAVLSVSGGERITETRELSLKVSLLPPGAKVRLAVIRKGREVEIRVVLAERPAETRVSAHGAEPRVTRALEGVEGQDLTPEIRRQLELPPKTNGVVVGVEPGSPAAEAGLERGDLIQEVNGEPVASVGQFEKSVRRKPAEPVTLLVSRGGSTLYVVIEPRRCRSSVLTPRSLYDA